MHCTASVRSIWSSIRPMEGWAAPEPHGLRTGLSSPPYTPWMPYGGGDSSRADHHLPRPIEAHTRGTRCLDPHPPTTPPSGRTSKRHRVCWRELDTHMPPGTACAEGATWVGEERGEDGPHNTTSSQPLHPTYHTCCPNTPTPHTPPPHINGGHPRRRPQPLPEGGSHHGRARGPPGHKEVAAGVSLTLTPTLTLYPFSRPPLTPTPLPPRPQLGSRAHWYRRTRRRAGYPEMCAPHAHSKATRREGASNREPGEGARGARWQVRPRANLSTPQTLLTAPTPPQLTTHTHTPTEGTT